MQGGDAIAAAAPVLQSALHDVLYKFREINAVRSYLRREFLGLVNRNSVLKSLEGFVVFANPSKSGKIMHGIYEEAVRV